MAYIHNVHNRDATARGKLGILVTTLCAISQIIALMESNLHNPHLQSNSNFIVAYKSQLLSYKKDTHNLPT